MGSLQQLEVKLDEMLNKKAPFKLPESAKKSLAGAWWWIALVLGIVQLWGALSLWRLAHSFDVVNRAVDEFNRYFGYRVADNHINFFLYLTVVVLLVDAVILLLAVPGLKAFKKAGWNLLFYSLLVYVAYGVARIFSDVAGGPGYLLWTLVETVVAAYFVFQVRDYFTGKVVSGAKTVKKTKTGK